MQGLFKILSFFVVFVSIGANSICSYGDFPAIVRFKNWVKEHNIQARDDSHLAHMFDNWFSNDKFIEETNEKNLSYTLGHNAYSGMNTEEFSEFMGFRINQELITNQDSLEKKTGFLRGSVPNISQSKVLNTSILPTFVDWRTKGAVSDVKDQGSCGSCFSFSSTGALEGIYAITHGDLVSFSEQQIVDCDNGLTKSHGCNGGLMDQVFSYVLSNGGLCTEQDYPYVSGSTQKAGTCQTSCKLVSGSKISKYTDVTPNSDNAMMTALAQQPVSVAICATTEFQLYKSGVFTGKCGTDLNHGVLLVGYSSENGQEYYILKNSWSSSWGMGGYILLGKNNNPATGKPYNDGAGQCGVLLQGSYPSL